MAIVLARFKVQDYDTWRQQFEGNAETRKAAGCNGTHIFFNADDTNDVTVNFQWDTAENAKSFLGGAPAAQLRAQAGVTGEFDFWVVEDGGRTPN
jgi:quinol monooxygenase YgiN